MPSRDGLIRSCILETINYTGCMSRLSTVKTQIAERSKKHRGKALTNLHHFIDESYLTECLQRMNRKSSSGVDRQSWPNYVKRSDGLLPILESRFKTGSYKAPPVRRVYIEKEDGKQRPLGIPTIEDKLLQTAVTQVLNPIYEADFYEHSYGYREGKSQHDAIRELFKQVSFKKKRYVIDADVKNCFTSLTHEHLRSFLEHRIGDGVIRRQINKWLKAGVLEGKKLSYPGSGVPQGGPISGLLCNIYLHYVLDDWFVTEIQPLLTNPSSLIRYADHFLLCFSSKKDADRVMAVLGKRFARFGLELHPSKTRQLELQEDRKSDTLNFLGFTHYMGQSHRGLWVLKRKTQSKRLRTSLVKLDDWLRHQWSVPIPEMLEKLNSKLRGHYQYYGMTFNIYQVSAYYHGGMRRLHRHLNRRSRSSHWTWEKFNLLIHKWYPLMEPKITHSYRAKP